MNLMRKLCYEFNPVRMAGIPEYKMLPLMERAIYRELLDLVWQSESQFKIALDPAMIASAIGCDQDLIELVVEKLTVGKKPLIVEELCLDAGDFSIHMIELKEQINTFKRLKEIEQQLVDAPRNTLSKKKKSLISKIRREENSNPNTKYLPSKDRHLTKYKGWMPTLRFVASGQVYIVNQELIDELTSRFPEKDLESEFIRIYDWLASNEEKRKSLAEMNNFIAGWINRSDSKGPINESSLDDLDDELDKLLNDQLAL